VPWSDRSLSPASENLARSCESPDLGDPSFPSNLGYGKQKNKVFQRFKALFSKIQGISSKNNGCLIVN
jgi:hypothetical protein